MATTTTSSTPTPQTSSTLPTTASSTSVESLTFDGISKHFNMPIADAANTLGVCSSVLKKICRDNGLVRWPYRKFLAGKSVEEIQKDAAREKKREMMELARAARQKDAATASSFTTSTMLQQQGNNLSQDGWTTDISGASRNFPSHMDESRQGLPNVPAYLDEFKQGFPSNGLSTVSLKWWGGRTSDSNEDEILGEEPATDELNKQQSHEVADDGEIVEEESNTISEKSEIGLQGTALLSSVRERAAAEGREVLKLGVYGGHRAFKLTRSEKLLLLKVFKSSLPSQWILD